MIRRLKEEKHMLFRKIARDWGEVQKDMDKFIKLEFKIQELEEKDDNIKI